MHGILIYHTQTRGVNNNPFQFTEVDRLENMPTKEDIKKYYLRVATVGVNWPLTNPREIANRVYHEINTQTGIALNMISQDEIIRHGSHTSTSIGDIIVINEEHYYVDGYGFFKFEPK